jgi:V/A-type H+/Na+-transporting ATPase subunit D
VSESSPTRSAVIELKDERRAMHEGYVFLDEKCLLLAGEILRQLERHATLQRTLAAAQERAVTTLQAAVARHGLRGLQVAPAAGEGGWRLQRERSALMGVKLQTAALQGVADSAPAAVEGSPELERCREAHAALIAAAVPLAALAGNLERLSAEYRRAVRRARALQDVMLPELARTIGDFEGRLEEMDQEEAVWARAALRDRPSVEPQR